MRLRIASWNINSARLREPLIARFLRQAKPDLLFLQEIKCLDEQFPQHGFAKLGWNHCAISGQKAYHGVAVLSRLPLRQLVASPVFARPRKDKRHLEARHLQCVITHAGRDILLHNFYVPAGGDVADAKTNPRFAHKLQFLKAMKTMLSTQTRHTVLLGDLNVAPEEQDVWSHQQMRRVVSHTPEEVKLLRAVQKSGGFIDAARFLAGYDKKLYSWWSYRARDWEASDRGRRLDHIWLTKDLLPALKTCRMVKAARGWISPSDHVPVVADFDFSG